MISVDSNVLVYAFKTNDENHAVAKETMDKLLNQKEQVAFTDIVMFEFIAQVTLKLGSAPAPSPAQALAQLENWLSAENVSVIRNSPENFATFNRLCVETGRTGQKIYDAQIAASKPATPSQRPSDARCASCCCSKALCRFKR